MVGLVTADGHRSPWEAVIPQSWPAQMIGQCGLERTVSFRPRRSVRESSVTPPPAGVGVGVGSSSPHGDSKSRPDHKLYGSWLVCDVFASWTERVHAQGSSMR